MTSTEWIPPMPPLTDTAIRNVKPCCPIIEGTLGIEVKLRDVH